MARTSSIGIVPLLVALTATGGCPSRSQPAETTPTLPGGDDEERHAARFAEPDKATAHPERVTPPSAGDADAAPGGTVVGLDGKTHDLAATYADNNAVLVFYRGHWCRFCRRQLGELQEHYREILRAGAHVFAVSTEPAETAKELAGRLRIEYPLLIDEQGNACRKWGVLDEENGIAKLATFVVQRGGKVVFRHVAKSSADYPATADVIRQVSSLPQAP